MIFSYEEFLSALNTTIKSNNDFYYELLINVINNPHRYTGVFRLNNAKTKLIQNVTQSREIKFGNFMEDIVTKYISKMNYLNMDKNIGTDPSGNALSADQVFKKNNTIYLIEQKIRDDHDSTKKRGQYENFRKKYTLLKNIYPKSSINASMWFIDDSMRKNYNYYFSEAQNEHLSNVHINIFYGSSLFDNLFNRPDVWEEIYTYLQKNKQERCNEILSIPDFDTSSEMLSALKLLKEKRPSLYKKLMSNTPVYVQLRSELFPTGANFKKL